MSPLSFSCSSSLSSSSSSSSSLRFVEWNQQERALSTQALRCREERAEQMRRGQREEYNEQGKQMRQSVSSLLSSAACFVASLISSSSSSSSPRIVSYDGINRNEVSVSRHYAAETIPEGLGFPCEPGSDSKVERRTRREATKQEEDVEERENIHDARNDR
ncbi:hypothetical protein PAMP_022794 [Pampus punctatissimus]